MLLPTLAATLLAASQLVAGHGAITKAVGNAGGQGSAIGIDPSTPRDGTKPNPFEQDTTRFKGAAADTCGSTKAGGANDAESGTATVLQQNGGTLPQVTPGGSVQMTLHQVNSDGAGPYTCMIDSTGTGTNWQAIQVSQNVDGNDKGRNKAGSATDHPLNVDIPANQTCTGTVAGQSNVCMVRCQNPANAGPFGGCVPIQMAGAGNSTTAAAPPAAGSTTGTATPGSTTDAAEKRDVEDELIPRAAKKGKKGKKGKGKKGKKAAGAGAGAAGADAAGATDRRSEALENMANSAKFRRA